MLTMAQEDTEDTEGTEETHHGDTEIWEIFLEKAPFSPCLRGERPSVSSISSNANLDPEPRP